MGSTSIVVVTVCAYIMTCMIFCINAALGLSNDDDDDDDSLWKTGLYFLSTANTLALVSYVLFVSNDN